MLWDVPLSWQIAGLAVLLAISGFFSIAETSMMAINRYRLRHLVSQGHRGAMKAEALLKRTDRVLGAILLSNTLVNAAATTLVTVIAIQLFDESDFVLLASTITITFLILVFAEITPKVIGATYPERIALPLAHVLGPVQVFVQPGVWFVNLFVRPLLRLAGVGTGETTEIQKLSPEEIRTLVLESSSFMPKKHISILLNLFDLGSVTVQDIMLPRARIESVKLDDDMPTIARHLATAYHMRLPVFRDARGDVLGVLHLRKVLAPLLAGTLDKPQIESLVVPPYYVPASTPVLAQLQYFQENRERIALVVDEYGELMGLVTLEDIIEEIIGKFTTSLPSAHALAWAEDGSASVDGATPVREVNRALGLELPTEGPKTMNGLILEHLRDIPEADVSVKIGEVPMEIVHAQGRAVKTVRVFRPQAPVEDVTERA
ncbi:MAG TPA: CNNM domain-containing protein [Burkholderiales bacterium]|nr:CNNM domain-containing protein [Burkholderiales bacterium]